MKPTPMQRIVVAGLRDDEPTVVRALHQLGVVEILDYDESEEGFALGRPFAQADELSRKVLKARTLLKELGLADAEPESVRPMARKTLLAELDSRLASVESETLKALDAREKARNALRDQQQRLSELAPLARLGFRLQDYRGYGTLQVFVGSVPSDPTRLVTGFSTAALTSFSAGKDANYFAAFVPKDKADAVSKALSASGFSEIPVPEGDGDPAALRTQLDRATGTLEASEEKANELVKGIAEKNRDFLFAAEDYLSIEVEKAEAPLRFASMKNTFVADGWVARSDLGLVEKSLDAIAPGRVRVVPVDPREGEEPPVAIPHSKSVGPFSGMLRLFAVPGYHEFDPTIILTIFFPIFFGLMVSDLGFGVVMAILGAVMATGRKGTDLGLGAMIDKKAIPQIGRIMLYGGVAAALFGWLVFADMFGIPFHAAHPGDTDWKSLAGWDIPILIQGAHAGGPLLEKFVDVGDLLAISVIFAAIHMGLGLVLGFMIQSHHDKKHAAAKVGWLLILVGFFSLMMIVGGGSPPGGAAVNGWMGNKVAHALATTIFAPFTGNVIFIPGLTMGMPLISIILIIVGIPVVAVGEGIIIAVLETLTLLSNIISYGRLAAVGIAEAGIHLGINNILLPQILGGNVAMAVVWGILLIVAQLFVFILGGLSAGIQSLRLHFFEQFTKFYTGGGKEFAPFGRKLKYVTE